MGFNNDGLQKIIKRLRKKKTKNYCRGEYIGKNKITPIEDSVQDYKKTFNQLFEYVDYFVLNVSSPNTPKLRELQKKEKLEVLISSVQLINQSKVLPKPVLIKISPDLNNSELDPPIFVKKYKIYGIVATNSTNKRDNLKQKKI